MKMRAQKLAAIGQLIEAFTQDDPSATIVQADGRTMADRARERYLWMLDADPAWEPPRRWCTCGFAKFLGLADNPPPRGSSKHD